MKWAGAGASLSGRDNGDGPGSRLSLK